MLRRETYLNNKCHLYYFLFLLLYAFTGVGTAAEIKGLATLEKLNIPIYMAATSGSPPESTQTFLTQPAPFKMHARYIIAKYSARRNSQLWLNSLLVGSSRSKIRKMESAILAFKQVINHDMYRGDHITFDIRPSVGTGILLNGEELAFIEDQNFQNALVNSWYSDRSTSKKFATQIRQKPKSTRLKAYENLTPDETHKDRNKLIISKISKVEAISKEVAQSQPKRKREKTTTVNAQAPKEQSSVPKQVSAKPVKKTFTETASSDAQISSASPVEEARRSSKVKQKKTPSKAPSIKTNEKTQKEADGSLFVSQLYETLREDYILSAENYIENKARPIPSMKVRRKPKGEAKLKVQLQSNAEQMVVVAVEVIEGEFEDSLKKSLATSIEKLKKIPLAPDALTSETFTLYVTLDFAKCKRSTSAWICF